MRHFLGTFRRPVPALTVLFLVETLPTFRLSLLFSIYYIEGVFCLSYSLPVSPSVATIYIPWGRGGGVYSLSSMAVVV